MSAKINTLKTFKSNQTLFVLFGLVLSIAVGVTLYLPLWGFSFPFISIVVYLAVCYLSMLTNHDEVEFDDLIEISSMSEFPRALKLVGYGLATFCISTLISLVYIFSNVGGNIRMILCSFLSLFVGCVAALFVKNELSKILGISIFSIVCIPVFYASLGVVSIVTLPICFIYFYKRS